TAKVWDARSGQELFPICPPPPNAPDQLPGRLQRLQPIEDQNAGPVNCIRWFGALFRMSLARPLGRTDYSCRLIRTLSQPGEPRAGVGVRREDRIEARRNPPLLDDQGQALEKPEARVLEGWQREGLCESQPFIAQQCKGQVQPIDRLDLLLSGLGAQAE